MNYYILGKTYGDGFGSQFQRIIYSILFAEFHRILFIYKDIETMEHNYDNENDFLDKATKCMNIKGHYLELSQINNDNYTEIKYINGEHNYGFCDKNIDMVTGDNAIFNKIKCCFWENKNRNFFENNKFNISVHIRRPNVHDNRVYGADTPDKYFLNVINHIRTKYSDKDLLFHIYSQGEIENFNHYLADDTVLHINEEVTQTFIGLVAADLLVTSRSSFSYVAALLSDAEIYHLPYVYHPTKKIWINTEEFYENNI